MRYGWAVGAGVMALLFTSVSEAHAAAAATFFGEIPQIATAFTALLYAIAVAVVVGLAINAVSDLGRGRMGEGVFGIFAVIVSSVLMFILVPQATAAGVALGMALR